MDRKVYVRMNCDWKSRDEYEKRKKKEKLNETYKVKEK
jgi:hypothetical protein